MMGGRGDGIDGFLAWAEGGAWLAGRWWVRAAGVLLPAVNLTAIVLYSLGPVPLPAMVWSLVVSTLLHTWLRKGLHRCFDEADDGESGVRRFAPLLAVLIDAPLQSAYAVEILRRLGAAPAGDRFSSRTAPTETATLRSLLDLSDDLTHLLGIDHCRMDDTSSNVISITFDGGPVPTLLIADTT